MRKLLFETLPPIGAIAAWLVALIQAINAGDANEILTVILVPLVVAVVQWLKQRGVRGRVLEWASYVLSFVLAGLVLFVTGQLPFLDLPVGDPATFVPALLELSAAIAAAATLLYKAVKDREVGGVQIGLKSVESIEG